MATSIPLWATIIISVVALTVATLVWYGITRVLSLLFDATKSRRISIVTATAIGTWLLLSVIVGTIIRPTISPSGTALVLGWVSVVVTIGYGLRFVSPTFRQIIEAMPQPWLLGVQFYRNLGGIIFLPLMVLGFLPPFFAIPAGGGDLPSPFGAVRSKE